MIRFLKLSLRKRVGEALKEHATVCFSFKMLYNSVIFCILCKNQLAENSLSVIHHKAVVIFVIVMLVLFGNTV